MCHNPFHTLLHAELVRHVLVKLNSKPLNSVSCVCMQLENSSLATCKRVWLLCVYMSVVLNVCFKPIIYKYTYEKER